MYNLNINNYSRKSNKRKNKKEKSHTHILSVHKSLELRGPIYIYIYNKDTHTFVDPSATITHQPSTPNMAATRVIVSANTTASSFLLKSPFLKPHQTLNLNKNANFLSLSNNKRLFSCKSLFKPEIITKEDGLPETLDYRVFFLEKSGRKVLSFWVFLASFCQ